METARMAAMSLWKFFLLLFLGLAAFVAVMSVAVPAMICGGWC